MKFDLTVFGGGTAGMAAAYIASKYGIRTLLVEKTDVLGGSITQGLVIPAMSVDTDGINTEFFNDLKHFADKYAARHTYLDGNEAWFNPELLKIVFDKMLESVKCNVLFSSEPRKIINNSNNLSFSVDILHKMLSIYIDTKYIIDATSEGTIFKLLDLKFQEKAEKPQAPTLRFIIGGIDMKIFANWIYSLDKDRNVTTIEENKDGIHLSTAYTWDKSKDWALRPIFEKAVDEGDLEYEDSAYFQVFSIPSMNGAVDLNCPQIILSDDEDISDPFVYARALKQGRERIYRIYNFLKKYFHGFENSYILHIADILGVRESNRVIGKYTYTKEDIIMSKMFDNIAFASDYPIDIHSNREGGGKLEYVKKRYYVPIEALISEDYDNLYAAGRIISAEFEAQAAVRTQQNCFSMGEACAKDILRKLKNQSK